MAIYKTATHIDTYRIKALKGRDVRDLSGRTGRPYLTDFIVNQILSHVRFNSDDTVVDIGCGDATLLRTVGSSAVRGPKAKLIGILPTLEEVHRVSDALRQQQQTHIQVIRGISTNTGLPDALADKVIINGVLLILNDETEVDKTLREIHRIAKPGATVFLGELPAGDEFVSRTYDDSFLGWLVWVIKKRGLGYFLARLTRVIKSIFGKEPVIVSPNHLLYMEPAAFVTKLESHGFVVEKQLKHKEVDAEGNQTESATRWDYVAIRK